MSFSSKSFSSPDERRSATDCATHDDIRNDGIRTCPFRHVHFIRKLDYCKDWVKLRDEGAPFCPRGKTCSWPHPYHKIVQSTDCPSCPPTSTNGKICKYTDGAPSLLRHIGTSDKPPCKYFSSLPGKTSCPSERNCTYAHPMIGSSSLRGSTAATYTPVNASSRPSYNASNTFPTSSSIPPPSSSFSPPSPPVSTFGKKTSFSSPDERRSATDCATHDDIRNDGIRTCPFRHVHFIRKLDYCKDWVKLRDEGAPFCPRGKTCSWPHPYHKIVQSTDCPSCPPTSTNGKICKYTDGAPSLLRHIGTSDKPPCKYFSSLPGKTSCPSERNCTYAHPMTSSYPSGSPPFTQSYNGGAAIDEADRATADARQAAAIAEAMKKRASDLRMLAEKTRQLVAETEKNGGGALHIAAARGSVDEVKKLLASGADPWVHNNENDTALHIAMRSRKKDVVELLLQVSSWCTINKNGWTPVEEALYKQVPLPKADPPPPPPTPQQIQKEWTDRQIKQNALYQQAQNTPFQNWNRYPQQVLPPLPAHCGHCKGCAAECSCQMNCAKTTSSQCTVIAASVPPPKPAKTPLRGLLLGEKIKDETAVFIEMKLISALAEKPGDPSKIWAAQRALDQLECRALDTLMGMTGLTKVKTVALNLFTEVRIDLKREPESRTTTVSAMNFIFTGNPGTGKTTVALLFAKLLKELELREGDDCEEKSGQQWLNEGSSKFLKSVEKMATSGGVIFIDEVYQLDPKTSKEGAAITNEILSAAEKHRKKITFIVAGYSDDVQNKWLSFNDGLSSRFPYVLNFEDFNELELRSIFLGMARTAKWRFEPPPPLPSGIVNPLKLADIASIAAKRLFRSSNRRGFGNARTARILFETAQKRTTARCDALRLNYNKDAIITITREDLLGPAIIPKNSKALKDIMALTGLKKVKDAVNGLVQLAVDNRECEERGDKPRDVSLHRLFLGNPGTGKTTVARLYGKLLKELGFLSNGDVVLKTASELTGNVVGAATTLMNNVFDEAAGKVLIIDEAYNLASSSYGKQALDTLVERVQPGSGEDIAVLLLGYTNEMTAMLRDCNPGLSRRFPLDDAFIFEDYADEELKSILLSMASMRGLKVSESDAEQSVKRVLARERMKKNFGNAGAVLTLLDKAIKRLSERRSRAITEKKPLPKEDVLEAEDLYAFRKRPDESSLQSFSKLNSLTGLLKVKEAVRGLVQMAADNFDREVQGKAPIEVSLHRLFLGNPGTGKTTVARLYGKLLKELGFLSNGDVVLKTASELTGNVVGAATTLMNNVFDEAAGKVLIIDEAYNLASSSYGKQALDTLVERVQPGSGEDIAVLLLGYTNEMTAMLRDCNPGLSRRFPLDDAFIFEDYADEELKSILLSMASMRGLKVSESDAEQSVKRVLARERMKKNFGNAGAVLTLLDKAIKRLSERRSRAITEKKPLPKEDVLEAEDLFVEEEAGSALKALSNLINADSIRKRVQELEQSFKGRKERGFSDPADLLTNWTFVGPPGTGKTTVARALGSIFNSLGLLPDDRVVEVKGADLTAGYVGQTKDIVNNKMTEARGGVLFIDEAYALDYSRPNASGFAQEAVETLLANLTSTNYKGKMVVVLAGYAQQIDGLLKCNPGLTRRFPERIDFLAWPPSACTDLALRQLKERKLNATSSSVVSAFTSNFERLSREYDGFGSAGDAIIAANNVETAYDAAGSRGDVTDKHVISAFDKIYSTRTRVPTLSVNIKFQGSSSFLTAGATSSIQPTFLNTFEKEEVHNDLSVTKEECKVTDVSVLAQKEDLETKLTAEFESNSDEQGDNQIGNIYDGNGRIDKFFGALLDVLNSRGYTPEDALSLVRSRDLPDDLVSEVAASAKSSNSEARTALLESAPAAESTLEAVVAEREAVRAAQEAIRLAADEAEKARLIAAEEERKLRMLAAMVCDLCGRQGCPVAPRLRVWMEGTPPPFPFKPYNGNNGPAVNAIA
jgi:SpoVK/Ycf46/Vps4 family AAA+-type ATPase